MTRIATIIAIAISLVACEEADNDPAPVTVGGGGSDAAQVDSGLTDAGVSGRECFASYDCTLDMACRDGMCVEVECLDDLECFDGETCAAAGLVGAADLGMVCTQAPGCNHSWAIVCADGRPYCNDPWTGRVSEDCPFDAPEFWLSE